MDTPDLYQTIASPSEGLYKEKGSKFLAYAYPVSSEDEIKDILTELKKQYYDARHHCYAWQLGTDGMTFRANDDGEPSGTAGKPIHGQLRSNNLTNVLVVVIRYFGGTKLGTSGLITAYREATADAIANAKIIERTVNDEYKISFGYLALNDVMRILKEEAPEITAQDFDNHCSITLNCRQSDVNKLIGRLEKVDAMDIQFIRTF